MGLPSNNGEDKNKIEIMNLFKEVCYKLDALSNLNFTPKNVISMAEVKTNVNSVKYEEKIPINMT